MKKSIKYRIPIDFAVKQTFHITVSDVWPILARLWAAGGVVLSAGTYLPEWIPSTFLSCFVIVCIAITVLCCLYFFVRNFIAFVCKQGIIRLYESDNHAFYLSIGGYEDTMQRILSSDKLLLELKEKDVQTVAFATGLDRMAQLNISSTKCVLRAVMNLLKNEYGLPIEKLQDRVDKSVVKAEKTTPLAYGECLSVSILPELEKELPYQMEDVSLLMIATSSHKVPPEEVNKEDLNELNDLAYVEDARKTIVNMFQYAQKQSIDCIVTGAMGTHLGKSPYAPVLDTIITAYEWCQRQGERSCPRIVVLSIRESDIKDHKLSLSYIVNRVRNTLKKLD